MIQQNLQPPFDKMAEYWVSYHAVKAIIGLPSGEVDGVYSI